MTHDDYSDFVKALFKEMGSPTLNLLHAAVGISGEAGELLDAVKKHWAYEKPLDRANVVEELGDLEFYMQAIRNELGIPRDRIIEANVIKLSKRYGTLRYSNEQAAARADKVEESHKSFLSDITLGHGV
jgi:NTP pyrophosphatase (non-canonical NTP hydrolase)